MVGGLFPGGPLPPIGPGPILPKPPVIKRKPTPGKPDAPDVGVVPEPGSPGYGEFIERHQQIEQQRQAEEARKAAERQAQEAAKRAAEQSQRATEQRRIEEIRKSAEEQARQQELQRIESERQRKAVQEALERQAQIIAQQRQKQTLDYDIIRKTQPNFGDTGFQPEKDWLPVEWLAEQKWGSKKVDYSKPTVYVDKQGKRHYTPYSTPYKQGYKEDAPGVHAESPTAAAPFVTIGGKQITKAEARALAKLPPDEQVKELFRLIGDKGKMLLPDNTTIKKADYAKLTPYEQKIAISYGLIALTEYQKKGYANALKEFEKAIKAQGDEFWTAYKKGGMPGYQAAINTYNARVGREQEENKQFNKNNVTISGLYMPRDVFESLDDKYRNIAIAQGFKSMQAAIDKDIAIQNEAIDKLEFALDKDGNYDFDKLASYFRTHSDGPQTIRDAQFDNAAELIRNIETYNLAPVSFDEFKQREYMDKGISEPKSLGKFDVRLGYLSKNEAEEKMRNDYIKIYGVGGYAGSAAAELATPLFPPARALRPDVSIQDISAREWATGAATIALFAIPVAPKGLGVGLGVGAGSVFTYNTIKEWDKLSTPEKITSVAMDTLILGGSAAVGAKYVGRLIEPGAVRVIDGISGRLQKAIETNDYITAKVEVSNLLKLGNRMKALNLPGADTVIARAKYLDLNLEIARKMTIMQSKSATVKEALAKLQAEINKAAKREGGYLNLDTINKQAEAISERNWNKLTDKLPDNVQKRSPQDIMEYLKERYTKEEIKKLFGEDSIEDLIDIEKIREKIIEEYRIQEKKIEEDYKKTQEELRAEDARLKQEELKAKQKTKPTEYPISRQEAEKFKLTERQLDEIFEKAGDNRDAFLREAEKKSKLNDFWSDFERQIEKTKQAEKDAALAKAAREVREATNTRLRWERERLSRIKEAKEAEKTKTEEKAKEEEKSAETKRTEAKTRAAEKKFREEEASREKSPYWKKVFESNKELTERVRRKRQEEARQIYEKWKKKQLKTKPQTVTKQQIKTAVKTKVKPLSKQQVKTTQKSLTAVKPAIKPATKTKMLALLKAALKTATKTKEKAKIRTAIEAISSAKIAKLEPTKEKVKVIPIQLNKQTFIEDKIKPPEKAEKTPPPKKTIKAPPPEDIIKPPPPGDRPPPEEPPPVPPPEKGKKKIKLPHGNGGISKEWTREDVKSAIAWRDGVVVHAIRSPYRRGVDEKSFSVNKLPQGLVVMRQYKGKGSQQLSAKTTGPFPSKLTVDVGNQDVIITRGKGNRVNLIHRRDITGTTSRTTIKKGRSISKRKGRIFHTRAAGGTILSRRGLRGY